MTDPIKAEPVAWMYRWRGREPVFLDSKRDWSSNSDWTETPLYTHAQLVEERRLAWNEAIEAAADWFADRFSDAVQADCESGVKWLNERAAKAYLKDAPDTLAAIREGEEAIRALSVPAIVEAGEHQPKENTDASSD